MTERRSRRGPLIATLVAVTVMVGMAVVFWRTMPPVIPAEALVARTARPFAGVPPLPSVVPRPRLDGVTAALVVEPENVRVNAPGQYERAQATWREWLADAGVRLVAPEAADVLIVARGRCLGPVHRRLIAAHLTQGRGVVSTGLLGANDGVCTPLADTLLAQLAGIRDGDIRNAPRRGSEPPYVVILGESALGAGIPPGPRLDLNPAGQIVFRTRARDVFYTDFERHPMTAGAPSFDAAVLRARVDAGRIVALGFELDDLDGDWSRDVGRLLAANAVRWAAGRPLFEIAPWPNGKKAAAVLAHDVEADYHNARQALDALEPYGLPGTAFIVGSLAEADPLTTRRLIAGMTEIGTHSHRHLPLDTLSDAEQARELANAKQVGERLVGRPVRGMRPPEERYTPRTLQIWADLGGAYVFANNNLRSASPEIIPLLPDSLVLLGRVSEDDYEILNRHKIRDRGQMTRLITSQVDESIAFRGLYMFSYHSHMFAQEELLPVLQALAEKLKGARDVWTTSAGEVADWWRARAAVTVVSTSDGRHVRVTNTGRGPFVGARLIIYPPTGTPRTVALPTLPAGQALVVDANGRVSAPVAASSGGD